MTDYLSKKIRNISFVAILLVMLQHAINFTGYINPATKFTGQGNGAALSQFFIGYGIARPAVALFFLLSGFLFFRNFVLTKIFDKYKSRLRTLLVPYILWNTLALLFIIGLQLLPAVQMHIRSFYTGYLPGQALAQYVQSIIHHGVAFQLWFLYDLMLYTLFAPVIYLAVRYLSWYLLIPLGVVWLLRIPMPSYLSFLDRGGLFYLIGACLAIHPFTFPDFTMKKIFPYLFGLWMILLVIKTWIAFGLNTYTPYLAVIDNAGISLGLLAIWFGYDELSHTNVIPWLGTQSYYTFFIYAAHEPLLELLKYAGITVMGITTTSLFVTYIGVPIFTYLCCLVTANFLKTYMSSIYKILTGGR